MISQKSSHLKHSIPVGVSVILPAYNEEETISKAIEKVQNILTDGHYDFEIIVVDDGSLDGTRKEALEAATDHRIKVVGYSTNMGKGYAIKYGLEFAFGEYVLFMDSDMEIDPSNIHEYLSSLREADIVIASKRHPRSSVKQPTVRRLLSYCFHIFVKLVTGLRFSDTQTGLKAFRIEAAEKIMPLSSVKGYAFDVEVLTVASLLKFKIIELPINIELNSMFKFRHIPRMFFDLLLIGYRLRISLFYHKLI